MSDRLAALSRGEAIARMDGLMPASRMVLLSAGEAYWLPWRSGGRSPPAGPCALSPS